MHSLKGDFDWPSSVLFDRDNSVWIGLYGDGLRRFSDFRHPNVSQIDKFVPGKGLSGGLIYSSFEDREGNVWLGTEGGLDRFSENKLMSLPVPDSVEARSQMGLNSTPDGTLWMYQYSDAGFYRYRAKRLSAGKWPAKVPVGRRILSIFAEDGGTAWLGGDFGLAHDVEGRISFLPVADNLTGGPVEAIAKAVDGSLWISFWAADSVERPMRLLHGVWTDFRKGEALPKYRCRVLHGDSLGRMWLGYEDGELAVYGNGSFQVYSSKDGLTGGQINTIYEDSNRHIWIGSDGGVSRFDGAHFVTLTARNGLPGQSIAGLLEDGEGFVWLAGSGGILRTHESELNKAFDSPSYEMKGTLLDAGDGLHAMPRQKEPFPTMTRTSDGRLWFSTTNGVFMLDQRHLPKNLVPPPVAIEEFKTDGRSLLKTEGVSKLSRPNPKIVQFDYTALSLTAPERIRFRYRLEGFDTDWGAPVSTRQATYTNLRPGDYRFRVIACNNDGVWNEEGASLAFTIPPSFTQTFWFKGLCLLAAVSTVFLAYRLRVRQVTTLIRERMYERLCERERIARDLHDTFFQGIQGLLLRFHTATTQLPKDEPARKVFEEALIQSDQVMLEGRELVLDLRASASEPKGLPAMLADYGEQFERADSCDFKVVVNGNTYRLHATAFEELSRIGKEAVGNAFRHSGAQSIEVELNYEPKSLRMRIRDNGSGIEPTVLKQGHRDGHFGMPGMRERAKKIGAHLDVWSRTGAGTEIELQMPASLAYASEPKGSAWDRLLRLWSRTDAKKERGIG